MSESNPYSPAIRFSRLFRKAGVLLAKQQIVEALAVLREGEALAEELQDTEKLLLFREEIIRCQQTPTSN